MNTDCPHPAGYFEEERRVRSLLSQTRADHERLLHLIRLRGSRRDPLLGTAIRQAAAYLSASLEALTEIRRQSSGIEAPVIPGLDRLRHAAQEALAQVAFGAE